MLSCKYSKFTLPKNITYLNCAYMSPLLKTVEKAGIRGVRVKRNPAGIQSEDFFTVPDQLKREFAKLINAPDAKSIAIIPSVSYGMANAARNVRIANGQSILVAAEQFPSNYYSWEALCSETGASLRIITPDREFKDRGKRWNERFLESIDNSTRVIAMAHTHWADGTLFDLQAIRKRADEVGALLIIDGTQSVGALPFDVRSIRPDALICAGYKWLLGPYSIGLAYYGDQFADGKPIEHNWLNRRDSDKFSSLVNYEPEFQPGAARFSMGEHSNFVLVPMILKAVEQLNRWGVSNIQEYIRSITADAVQSLQEQGFLIGDDHFRATHLFGVRHPKGIDPEKLKRALDKYKVYVSIRGDAVRVSPHVYNDRSDLDRLVKALRSAIA